MVKVSVIIPVYNSENAIERCISSVLYQEFKDLEIIVVDDGSTDQSGKILDKLANEDSRLRIIHTENKGVSAARNLAIKEAKGTYIQFMDADDYIPTDSTKMLVRTMEENHCDLVIADFYRVVGDNVARKGSIRSDDVLTLQQFAECMMDSPSDFYYGVLWNKLYRRDLIQDNQLEMDESLNFCEDFIFNMEYLLHTKTIKPLQVPIYYYVKTEGSLVTQSRSVWKVVAMKTNVYTYYNNFFKNVLDEKQYRKDRLAIAGFLVDSASDDFAIPMFPGTRKLGEETVIAHFHGDRKKESFDIISMAYYLNKVFEKYEQTIAYKNDLDLKDIKIILAIWVADSIHSPKEISDFTGLSQVTVSGETEYLNLKGYVKMAFEERKLAIRLTDKCNEIIKDLQDAFEDLESVIFEGLTQEDIDRVKKSFSIINNNLQEHLFGIEDKIPTKRKNNSKKKNTILLKESS